MQQAAEEGAGAQFDDPSQKMNESELAIEEEERAKELERQERKLQEIQEK